MFKFEPQHNRPPDATLPATFDVLTSLLTDKSNTFCMHRPGGTMSTSTNNTSTISTTGTQHQPQQQQLQQVQRQQLQQLSALQLLAMSALDTPRKLSMNKGKFPRPSSEANNGKPICATRLVSVNHPLVNNLLNVHLTNGLLNVPLSYTPPLHVDVIGMCVIIFLTKVTYINYTYTLISAIQYMSVLLKTCNSYIKHIKMYNPQFLYPAPSQTLVTHLIRLNCTLLWTHPLASYIKTALLYF